MRRREFIASTAGAAAGLILRRITAAADGPPPGPRPNVLFVMTDQQHAGMMSCTGNEWLHTPAMDRLAASGVRFERAYCCNPICVPSRFSLQTGRFPSAAGIRHNGDAGRAAVTDAMMEQCLGRLFRDAGYETVYGGKVHLPSRMNEMSGMGYRYLSRDRRQGLAGACAEFIRGAHERPFFLFASFINPHDICYMAINEFRRSRGEAPLDNEDSRVCEALLAPVREGGDIDAFVEANCPPLPANHEVPEGEPDCIAEKYAPPGSFLAYVRGNWTERDWRLHRWAYARLTEMVDGEIGTVLDAIHEAGLERETLVVFTSDHGDMDSAHRLEHKAVPYEESARVPLVMSWPGMIREGAVDAAHLVSNGLDLLPTLCDYAGIGTPEGLHGASLRPVAEGKQVPEWREFVVSEGQNGRMLRTGRYKYCIYDSGEHREQLIDLEEDPGEMKNLAGLAGYGDVLERHRRLLREWVERTGDAMAAEYVAVGT